MAQQQVTTPYHHDVQVNGTPIVPSSSDAQLGVVPVANADGTNVGGGTQYTDGNATPAHPVGNMLIFDNAGTLAKVAANQGLPVNVVAGSAANGAASNTGVAVPTQADYSGLNVGGTLRGRTGVNPSGSVYAAQTDITSIGGTTVNTAANGTLLVGLADGAGNKLTTNSTTYTAKFGLDANLLGTLGTAFSTAGFVDIKGADGNVFVRNATAANFKAQVVAGDATGSAVPANAYYQAFLAKTALPTAGSDGNLVGAMADKFGRQVVIPQGMRDLVTPITKLTLTASTTETTLISAIASVFADILDLNIVNTSATVCQVDIRDATAGTIRATFLVPPTDMRGAVYQVPIPQNAVNNNWTAQCGTSVSSIIITGKYISNK